MRGLSWKAHRILIASRQTEKTIPMHTARRESFAESRFFATKETVMNPICTALVPALQVHCGSWWDSRLRVEPMAAMAAATAAVDPGPSVQRSRSQKSPAQRWGSALCGSTLSGSCIDDKHAGGNPSYSLRPEIDTTSLAPTVPPREVIGRFWPAVRPYRGRLAIVLVLAMIGPLLDTLSISLYGRLVDEVLVPRQSGDAGADRGGVRRADSSRRYARVWAVISVSLDHRASALRSAQPALRALQTLPLEFFERSRLGDTVTRVTEDIDELGEFLATASPTACPTCSRSSSLWARSSLSMPASR